MLGLGMLNHEWSKLYVFWKSTNIPAVNFASASGRSFIIPYGRKYTFVELVFAIIPFSVQFRCLLLATAFDLLERTDKKEFLDAEILL